MDDYGSFSYITKKYLCLIIEFERREVLISISRSAEN